jgi:hypothetical protein
MRLERSDLLSLEDYAEQRARFRERVMKHKQQRRLSLGDHITLHFESRLTMQYQIQEMLRIERIFEREAIEEELATYNPLIPSGEGWRATMMIEYGDPDQRKRELARLVGVEDRVSFRASTDDGQTLVLPARANPDLERSTADKTSAVHFLFWDMHAEVRERILTATHWAFAVDHPNYEALAPVPETLRRQLTADLREQVIEDLTQNAQVP